MIGATLQDTLTETPELHFIGGLIGFPQAKRFVLVRWGGDDSPFSLMRSLDDLDLAFLVVPPQVFFADYAPEIDDETVERLELRDSEDALVLVLLTLGDSVETATANLMGPIVINRHTNEAAQAVLANSNYEIRTPIARS